MIVKRRSLGRLNLEGFCVAREHPHGWSDSCTSVQDTVSFQPLLSILSSALCRQPRFRSEPIAFFFRSTGIDVDKVGRSFDIFDFLKPNSMTKPSIQITLEQTAM